MSAAVVATDTAGDRLSNLSGVLTGCYHRCLFRGSYSPAMNHGLDPSHLIKGYPLILPCRYAIVSFDNALRVILLFINK